MAFIGVGHCLNKDYYKMLSNKSLAKKTISIYLLGLYFKASK